MGEVIVGGSEGHIAIFSWFQPVPMVIEPFLTEPSPKLVNRSGHINQMKHKSAKPDRNRTQPDRGNTTGNRTCDDFK